MKIEDKDVEAEMVRMGKQIDDEIIAKGLKPFEIFRHTGIGDIQLKYIRLAKKNYTVVIWLKLRKFLGMLPDYEQGVVDTISLYNVLPSGTDIKDYGPEIFKRLTGKTEGGD